MTWDTNYPNQEGTKGNMTIIDRKNLLVFGIHAMEGINEIYPRPSESAIKNTLQATDEKPKAVYNLYGQKADGRHLSPGIYVCEGRKFVVDR